MLHPLPDCGAREKISDALKVHKALALSHIPIAPTLSKLISPHSPCPCVPYPFAPPFPSALFSVLTFISFRINVCFCSGPDRELSSYVISLLRCLSLTLFNHLHYPCSRIFLYRLLSVFLFISFLTVIMLLSYLYCVLVMFVFTCITSGR